MHRRQKHLALILIVVVTTFGIVVTWPGNPDKYLPDFVPWPSGQGLNVGDFDRDAFRLGLDLAGGVSVTLEASGESAPVRPGETLNDFSSRTEIDLHTLLDRNASLSRLRPDEYGQPLPEEIDTLVLPISIDEAALDDVIQEARRIIEERVNGFGISEAEVTILGSDRISVQIPGVSGEQAADLVGSTAQLEFREIDPLQRVPAPSLDPFAVRSTLADAFDPVLRAPGYPAPAQITSFIVPDPNADVILAGGSRWIPAVGRDQDGESVRLTGRFLRPDSIQRTLDNSGLPALAFEFNRTGATLMAQVTRRLVRNNDPLGIFIDGVLISAPIVQAVISERGIITGINEEDAATLRRQLRAGALPINFQVIQQTEVAASLGEDSVVDTVQAGLVAFLVIVIYMVVYYRLPGVVAALALLIYVSLVMATFKLVPITLTLPGVAGFILSLGLAVDGNVLIFERMKEELRTGTTLARAIEIGWRRAWPAIRDANVSTLITVAILWFFADRLNANLIKSFAVALLVGTSFSILTSVFVTRSFLHAIADLPALRNPWLFGLRELPGEAPSAPGSAPDAARQVAGGGGARLT